MGVLECCEKRRNVKTTRGLFFWRAVTYPFFQVGLVGSCSSIAGHEHFKWSALPPCGVCCEEWAVKQLLLTFQVACLYSRERGRANCMCSKKEQFDGGVCDVMVCHSVCQLSGCLCTRRYCQLIALWHILIMQPANQKLQ